LNGSLAAIPVPLGPGQGGLSIRAEATNVAPPPYRRENLPLFKREFFKLAGASGLGNEKTMRIIEEVQNAVSQWKGFAKEAGVSSVSSKMIQASLNRVAEDLVR